MRLNYDLKCYLNKDCFNQLKGIAILLVLLGHLNIIRHAGAWGVAIFLVVSGFGLTQSYFKNGVEEFIEKRLSKVWLPYAIVTLIWIIIDFFLRFEYSYKDAVKALIGLNFIGVFDASMWYITFILIWYVIFYFTFANIKNDRLKIIILFLFSGLLYKFDFFHPAVGSYLYVLEFPIGILLGFIYKKLISTNPSPSKIVITQSILGIIAFSIFYLLYSRFRSDITYLLESLFFAIAAFNFCGILSICTTRLKVIESIGNISFNIYLFEYVFINKYRFIFNLNLNIWIERIIYLIFVLCISILFGKFMKTLYNLNLSEPEND